MTTNANLPAMPVEFNGFGLYEPAAFTGLTKLELFCLHHGVPETGDPDLDSIIRKGNHQKAAMMAMQALIQVYWGDLDDYDSASALLKCLAESSDEHATALFYQLDKQQ